MYVFFFIQLQYELFFLMYIISFLALYAKLFGKDFWKLTFTCFFVFCDIYRQSSVFFLILFFFFLMIIYSLVEKTNHTTITVLAKVVHTQLRPNKHTTDLHKELLQDRVTADTLSREDTPNKVDTLSRPTINREDTLNISSREGTLSISNREDTLSISSREDTILPSNNQSLFNSNLKRVITVVVWHA